MTDIKALAEERVRLHATLAGIRVWNTAGQTVETLTEIELLKINTRQRLNQINAEIDDYEHEAATWARSASAT